MRALRIALVLAIILCATALCDAATAQQPSADNNRRICLSGQFPSLCERSRLSVADQAQARMEASQRAQTSPRGLAAGGAGRSFSRNHLGARLR